MKNKTTSVTTVIVKKELRHVFFSPMGYIIMTLFLIVAGWFSFTFPPFFVIGRADLQNFFRFLPSIFAMAVPAITMRLFSEEFKGGSYEILGTLPIKSRQIVMGKFLAAIAFIAILLLPTLLYPLIIDLLGDLDWGPVWGGYIGALFMGASLASVGLFFSSLTRNQIVAFVLSVTAAFFLTLIDKMVIIFPGILGLIFQNISVAWHFDSITKGIINFRDLLYFVSMTTIFLMGTSLVIRDKQ